MKKTVFTILAGLFLVALTGCKAENEGDLYTKVEGLTCTLFTLFVFDLEDPTNEYQEDEMTFLIFTKEGKTNLAFVTEEAAECSYNINDTLRINNEKGKLFYETNNKSPLVERDYNGTTIDNGKLFYVVDTYIE